MGAVVKSKIENESKLTNVAFSHQEILQSRGKAKALPSDCGSVSKDICKMHTGCCVGEKYTQSNIFLEVEKDMDT